MPGDNAGNTLESARELRVGAGLQTFSDRVDSLDLNDYYRFTVTSQSSLNLALSSVGGDANVQLLSSSGGLVDSSGNSSGVADAINTLLAPGTYYIRVLPGDPTGTDYTLGFQLQAGAPNLSLFWRDAASSSNGIWQMGGANNTVIAAIASLPSVDPTWQAEAIADFNQDGTADILWRDTATGNNGIWLMNRANEIAAIASLPSASTNWQIGGVADFNGDGTLDIVWRDAATGNNGVWLMGGANNATITAIASLPFASTNWQIAAVADFNGDGHPDLIWRDATTGSNGVWLMGGSNNTTLSSVVSLASVAGNWQIAGIADFNTDGNADLVWRDTATGNNGVWLMGGANNATITAIATLPSATPNWQAIPITQSAPPPHLDLAGNDFATPFNIGTLAGNAVFRDEIGGTDPNDFYRMAIGAPSNLNLTINGLSADADVQLYDNTGILLQTSARSGTASETITTTLSAGNYYVRVYAGSSSTRYTLDLTTTPAPLSIVTLAATDANAAETTSGQTPNPGQFTITRTGSTSTALTVNYTISGTATNGSDYSPLGTSIVIPVGQSSITVPITVIDDSLVENSETVVLTLATNSAYTLGSTTTGTVTIADNDTVSGKLLASDGAANDNFGSSIAIDGNTMIAGARWDDNQNGVDAGAAYIYQFNGTSWVQQAKLTASDGTAGDLFGQSVRISGNTAIVGAREDSAHGAAYIYQYNGSSWVQQAKLTASDGADFDNFGFSLAISGNKAVVGAYTNNAVGAAYVYQYNGSSWVQQAKITASNLTSSSAQFGYSVAINDDQIAIGAIGEEAVYTYQYSGSSWVQQAKLTADDPNSRLFGDSVAIDARKDRLIIGADGSKTNAGPDSGAAYIFQFNGANWAKQAKLTASNGISGDIFAGSVGISGDTAIVGAYQGFRTPKGNGAAYLYKFNGTSWVETQLIASDGQSGDYFGVQVAISGSTAIVAATRDTIGSNAEQGSVYVFSNSSPIPIVAIAATDANAAETTNGQPPNPGQFTITRTGSTSTALTVNYIISGTATNGTDYSPLGSSIVIPVGQSSITVPINVIDDIVFEGSETVALTIATNNAYILGPSTSGTVNITDNDVAPIVTIAATDANAAETTSGQTANPGQFTITRTGSTSTALTVNYTLSGTATNGSDYSSLGTSIVIPVGQSSITIPINVIDDSLVEGSETIALTLATNSAYTLGTSKTSTVTIADNDTASPAPTVTIAATDANAAETTSGQTANPGQFTITRTGSTSTALTVNYTISGTATNSTDYSRLNGSIVIPIGQSSVTVPITVIDDSLVENSETVVLTLATNSAYTLGTSKTSTVTIADNDTASPPPTVTIAATDANAAETTSGQTANPGQFTITRTGSTSTALTVNYTISGTATNSTDYSRLNGSIVIPIGQSSITVPITVIDDSLVENSETVVLTLATNSAYTLGTSKTSTVTIADNETTLSDPIVRTKPATGTNDIDALLPNTHTFWDTSANGGAITYSFYNASSGSYYGSERVSEVSDAIKTNVREILASLESLINVHFVEVADTSSRYGVLRYMFSNGPGYAYAYYPGTNPIGGDVHLSPNYEYSSDEAFSSGKGSYGYEGIIHETLHALGLKHPGDYNAGGGGTEGPYLSPSTDNDTNTIMSYNNSGYGTGAAPITPMAYDIRALQYLYGATNNNPTATTYTFSSVYGYTVNGQFFGNTQQIKQALWDSDGIDTLDFSGLSANTSYRFDLNQGGLLTTQQAYNGSTYTDEATGGSYKTTTLGTEIAFNTVIENLINSRGNDTIIANSANNVFKGYSSTLTTGNDAIEGGNALDVLDLTTYRLTDLTSTVSGNDLTIRLGTNGSVLAKNYFGSGNSMKVLVSGTYYTYSASAGWQVSTAPATLPPTPLFDFPTNVPSSPVTIENLQPVA